VSGKLKLGMGVPSSRMLDGTAILRLVPRLAGLRNHDARRSVLTARVHGAQR
jgi:hypothetical protein